MSDQDPQGNSADNRNNSDVINNYDCHGEGADVGDYHWRIRQSMVIAGLSIGRNRTLRLVIYIPYTSTDIHESGILIGQDYHTTAALMRYRSIGFRRYCKTACPSLVKGHY
jgi:hypothetical protein